MDAPSDFDRLDYTNPGALKSIFAFVATRNDGKEGIVSGWFNGEVTPFIACDLRRVEALLPNAIEFARLRPDVTVRLVRFERREDIREL